MKKLLSLMLTLVTILSLSTFFVSCKEKCVDPVVITISQEASVEGLTLQDYMEQLQEDGELSFSIENGMITKINGTKNGTNSFWMLYTNDTENSNTAWGTYEYNEVVFRRQLLERKVYLLKRAVLIFGYIKLFKV